MELKNKSCKNYSGVEDPLTEDQLDKYLEQVHDDWMVEEEIMISREFEFKDFNQSLDFVNKVASIANKENHHPDLHIYFDKVVVDLWTHSMEGLTENDFILAAKIDELYNQ